MRRWTADGGRLTMDDGWYPKPSERRLLRVGMGFSTRFNGFEEIAAKPQLSSAKGFNPGGEEQKAFRESYSFNSHQTFQSLLRNLLRRLRNW